MAENIKVAVRVRPFNAREKGRGAQLVVNMAGQVTLLHDPVNTAVPPRKFAFDHSYWSHSGYKPTSSGYNVSTEERYVDQDQVFTELGKPMLANAWDGYNCSIFAYGQTGSGKSYSIMGHGANKGIVPRICEQLFRDITTRKQAGVQYEVSFSMLEIYNEHVRCLIKKDQMKSNNLHVKERPGRGFYVEGLTVSPIGSYEEIRLRMEEGERQRTIASTKMNETSSRAHTIVAINFAQNSIKQKMTKHSVINLVDLAGSERVKQTEATGDRFREATNINKSLLTLGNVIKGLCDKMKGANCMIPYRESVLTKLLKNALGGNSKTIMIAAIGPDAENYEQTLSTLRYADRAKAIKTTALVNQTATDKLIGELIAEKERLLRELQKAKVDGSGPSTTEFQRIKEQEEEIRRYKAQMEDIGKAWEARLAEARKEIEEMREREKLSQDEEKRIPHFSNLNEDPALIGKLNHLIHPGRNRIGNGKDGAAPEIVLNGPRVVHEHASVTNTKGKVTLKPEFGLVLYNGQAQTSEVLLHHQDRIRFGSNNLFVFINPVEAEGLRKKGRTFREITYEFAQDEIAKYQGLDVEAEDAVLKEEVMSIMQIVQDVNAMAEDMNKHVDFNIVLVSAEARGLDEGRTEVYIRVHDLDNDNEFLWDRNKFLIRQSHMQEMFETFENTGSYPKLSKEKDPFWEPSDTDVIVGVVSVPLTFVAHQVPFKEDPLTVIDYRANQSGFLKVEMLPSNSKGLEDDDLMVRDPVDLVNKPMVLKLKIYKAMNLPEKYVETWCRYRFYDERNFTMTGTVKGTHPEYKHERTLRFDAALVDHKFIDYLSERSLVIEIWGHQGGRSSSNTSRRPHVHKEKLKEDLDYYKRLSKHHQDRLSRIGDIVGNRPKGQERQQSVS